jgi:cytochrome P450
MAPANYLNSRIRGFANRRQAQPGPKGDVSDFLTKLVNAHNQSPGQFTELLILLGCSSNVIAGSDTTSIALSSTIIHLFREPPTLTKLREEIKKATEAGKVSVLIKFSESLELKYLQAVIKEALRIHPSTGFPMG